MPRVEAPDLARRLARRPTTASPPAELLAERHPPGSGPTFGFNYKDDETAWVRAEDGIDLQSIVDEGLASDAND